MTQNQMQLLVPQKLKQIEHEYGIRVLYAAESGSRAWGTCRAESDFDVRFIYIRPREDYLRLVPLRDVLEFPLQEGWDLCGWDLTKTLQLLHGSNTQVYEWLGSPVVYADDGFSQRLRPALEACFAPRTAAFHCLHLAELNLKKLSQSETAKVKLYLYVLQYLAAARWILRRREPAAVDFSQVITLLPEEIRREARQLLQRKTATPPMPILPHRPQLDAWMKSEWERLRQEAAELPPAEKPDWAMLDRFFLSELERL